MPSNNPILPKFFCQRFPHKLSLIYLHTKNLKVETQWISRFFFFKTNRTPHFSPRATTSVSTRSLCVRFSWIFHFYWFAVPAQWKRIPYRFGWVWRALLDLMIVVGDDVDVDDEGEFDYEEHLWIRWEWILRHWALHTSSAAVVDATR